MTQIIAVLAQQYVLVAADRRLTFTAGPRQGQIADDTACKLVCLCGLSGIAYTGFAEMGGAPTHEWIATQLADHCCRSSYVAAQVLAEASARTLGDKLCQLELTFLIAGWRIGGQRALQPHFLMASNAWDEGGRRRAAPARYLTVAERRLAPNELYASLVIGQPLSTGHGKHLHRFVRAALEHGTGPKLVMRAFVKEIVATSKSRTQSTVGERILAFSIPKRAAAGVLTTGVFRMLAMEPDLENTAFCSFEPDYEQTQQYGPTFVCGDAAMTDIETRDYPSGAQSSSVRLLRVPKGPA